MSELFTAYSAVLDTWLPAALIRTLRQADPSPEATAEAMERLSAAVARLEPFAPSLVIDRLAESPPAYTRTCGAYVFGTVVVAEVSGLAALSTRLASTGRRGDELAGAIVNRLLAALIGAVHANGGGVIKAAGDSLTAFFDARRLGESHAAHAAEAALLMQRRMAELRAREGELMAQLQLRVAAHSGRVLVVEVGDQTHAELLVTGYTISRVSRALLGAAPGEIIVTDKLLQQLEGADAPLKVAGQHVLRGLAEHPPAPPPTLHTAPPPDPPTLLELAQRVAALMPYAPHGIAGRLAGATLGGGDFRPATILLANFCAFNRLLDLLELPALIESDPTIVGHVLNTYYTRIQAVIQRYGGVVSRIDLAPYGDRFLALFGAPTAHEDDAARAVQTALTIRAELSETNQAITALLRDWAEAHPDQQRLVYLMSMTLRHRVGIASGHVFAGIVGAPERHEYAVIGQPMHVAARLLAGAEDNETLLAGETYQAVSHLVAVQPHPEVKVEGSARSVAVFRAVQPRFDAAQSNRQLSRSAPLIGRASELSRAIEVAQQALGPAGGRVLAFVGSPGVGKSRLADEMLRAVRGRVPAATLVHEVCQSYDEAVPYATLARLLRRLLYIPAAADRAAQARAVYEQVEDLVPDWARFAPLLGPLLGLPLADTDATLALTSEQRRERLHELVLMLCVALARRQPLALVVDDLQWADASSRSVLLRVAEELAGHPILLLVIFRPSPELAEAWEKLPRATTITLRDLPAPESEELLRALLNGPLPPELRPLIERAHGTPLFVEEMVRYLLDSGVLERDASGEWSCARPVDRSAVPAQIEQILVARLDQLDAATRAVVEIAAVIGQPFSERLLAAVVQEGGGETAALPEMLDALVRAEVLTLDASDMATAYAFRHALIRDVAYGSILFARRHELHAQVAAAIERAYADELDEQRGILAQHYLHAGRSDLAFPHLVQAAQLAQARYAASEALALYRQALAIAPQHDQATELLDEQIASLYENLGDILALTGDYAAARGNYEWLLRVGVAADPQTRALRKAALQRKVGGTYEQQGSLDHALVWCERAAETVAGIAGSSEADLEHARILSDMGWISYRRGDIAEAQRYLEQALALVEPHQSHAELARLYNRLGGIAWSRGDVEGSQYYVELSLEACERSNDVAGQAHALNNLGILTASQGRSGDAVRYGTQAMALNERIGNRRLLAVNCINVGHALYDAEDYLQSIAYFSQALDLAIQVRDVYNQMRAHFGLGLAHLAALQPQQAEQAFQRGQFLALQLHIPSEQLEAYAGLAEVALFNGQIDRALEYFAQAKELEIDPESEEYGRLQRLEAKLALAQGDHERAVELLQRSAHLFAQLQDFPEARRTHNLLSELLPAERER